MPQEPKKRHSRQRKGKRRASIHLKKPEFLVCPNCQNIIFSHKVCKKCGFYNGKQVLTIKVKKTNSPARSGTESKPRLRKKNENPL